MLDKNSARILNELAMNKNSLAKQHEALRGHRQKEELHLLFYINVLNNIPSDVFTYTYILSLPYLNQWPGMIGSPGWLSW